MHIDDIIIVDIQIQIKITAYRYFKDLLLFFYIYLAIRATYIIILQY